MADLLPALALFDLSAWLGTLDLPVLVVVGSHDRLTPPRHALRTAAALPHSELVELPRCGHMPMIERRHEFARLIEEFAAKIGLTAPGGRGADPAIPCRRWAPWPSSQTEALACTRCALAAGRTQVVFGVGDPDASLMFVGEGPGRDEDLAGEPFVGRSGKLLDKLLHQEIGLERSQCYIANVVKCRPPGNRDPLPDEIASCRPYLEAQIELIAPRVVVTLGNFATRLLLDTTEGIRRLRGRAYPFRGGHTRPHVPPRGRVARRCRGGGGDARRLRPGQAAPGRRRP